ncbi:MAG: pectin esterase [Clostridia bacterium]|nr:pectin esterase [Clostridia bacterium]
MSEWHIGPNENLQDVFDLAPAGTTIHLHRGIYRQKICIRTPGLKIIGDSPDHTVIVNGDYARNLDSVNRLFNTFRTYTVAVAADGVQFSNLTISNDAGSPEVKGQQIALSVYGNDFIMRNCKLISTQDTLFLGPLPPDLIIRYRDLLSPFLRSPNPLSSLFENTLIEGSVDFIFGCGDASFSNCEMRSVAQIGSRGYVAAPSHSEDDRFGFVFSGCRFTADSDVPAHSVFLARPWRDYGKAVFTSCQYGNHIHPLGFDPWGSTSRYETARFYESPMPDGRVTWARKL